jgi:hypothetical protein
LAELVCGAAPIQRGAEIFADLLNLRGLQQDRAERLCLVAVAQIIGLLVQDFQVLRQRALQQ